MRKKLKAYVNVAEFRIIDDFTAQDIELLPRAEALKKYGDCVVRCGYTEKWLGNGWRTSVWLDIPGMKLSGYDNQRINIPGGTSDEATFRGRKTGMLITVTKYGENDYSAWWHDEEGKETDGYSVRGTMWQIVDEMKGEY